MNLSTAAKLVQLRKKKNLTQEELAEKLGVSRQAVSKWECGEALPDTENLVMIARLYGVSLDALLDVSASAVDMAEERGDDEAPEHLHLSVPERAEDAPRASEAEKDDDDEDEGSEGKPCATEIVFNAAAPLLITVAFFLWGFLGGAWKIAWTLFLLIPVFGSVFECFRKKRICAFCYPVAIAFVYLFFGMRNGWWHPNWVLFLTIPVFYAVFDALDKALMARRSRARDNSRTQ